MRTQAERTAGFGTSIFTEISQLAGKHGAVNLGQGFPDFAAPDFVKAAATRALAADHNQYAVSFGVPRLRKALAARWQERTGAAIDADTQIAVASGATEVLFDAVLGLVDAGDEVVVFEPFYDAYLPDIVMAGGVPRVVRLRPPDWSFDEAELRAACGPQTRLIIVNTPHNPTGKVFTRNELGVIAELCRNHDVIALCDEVYSELVYPGAEHVSLATLPGMAERTLTIDSMGKTFSVTGWKIGWAIGPAALCRAVRATHQFVTFASATPFQEALADALEVARGNGYYDTLRREYAARCDRLARVLDAAGIPALPIAGSYFLMAQLDRTGFRTDAEFCRHLITEVGVAAIPPSAFYLDPKTAPLLARFCFAKKDETIDAAGQRMRTRWSE